MAHVGSTDGLVVGWQWCVLVCERSFHRLRVWFRLLFRFCMVVVVVRHVRVVELGAMVVLGAMVELGIRMVLVNRNRMKVREEHSYQLLQHRHRLRTVGGRSHRSNQDRLVRHVGCCMHIRQLVDHHFGRKFRPAEVQLVHSVCHKKKSISVLFE